MHSPSLHRSFVMSAAGRGHIERAFGCYTGGIDAHLARGWLEPGGDGGLGADRLARRKTAARPVEDCRPCRQGLSTEEGNQAFPDLPQIVGQASGRAEEKSTPGDAA